MKLSETDLNRFAQLGITREIVERAKIARVTVTEAATDFGILNADSSGLVFPYFLPQSNGYRVTARLRQDKPAIDESGRPRKYLCAIGDNRHLYFPPCKPEWIQSSAPLIFVEAEKSALALLRWAEAHDLPHVPVGLGGCWAWRGRIGKTVDANGKRVDEKGALPDLAIAKARRCFVLYDVNVRTNAEVYRARQGFIDALAEVGAREVLVIELPELAGVNGPDDYLGSQQGGDTGFFELWRTATLRLKAEEAAAPISVPDMPEEALDGRLGELCQRRLLCYGLPRAYAYLALVTAAGALVPPSAQRTNLFTCLVGDVGTGKSVSINAAYLVMGVPETIRQNMKAGSAEGLMLHLADAFGDHRSVVVDELGHLLAKSRIDGASFPFVLNQAYYNTAFEMIIARGKKIPVNCQLGVIGGLVSNAFGESFSSATTLGLHDRFVFGRCPEPWEFNWRPLDSRSEVTEPCRVEIADDVWEARDSWKLPGRVTENALRVAVIAAAFSGRLVLQAKHLAPARAFAEYQKRVRQVLRPNPGENPDAICAFQILNALPEAGWMEHRELYRKIHGDKFGPGVFRKAVENLTFTGDIEADKSGRKARYRRA
jgi:hypothetical protein